jgi:hypothetical protein
VVMAALGIGAGLEESSWKGEKDWGQIDGDPMKEEISRV